MSPCLQHLAAYTTPPGYIGTYVNGTGTEGYLDTHPVEQRCAKRRGIETSQTVHRVTIT